MKKIHEDSLEVDGFEDLSEEDQARFSKVIQINLGSSTPTSCCF
jgi:hypothetical protein